MHLSSSISLWASDEKRSPEEKEKSLLRYTLLHMQEYLELTEQKSFENFHAAEVYITPSIKPNIFTGDILLEKSTGLHFIVLTPSCDLAQLKAKDILIALIEDNASSIINDQKNIVKKYDKDDSRYLDAEKVLLNLIGNSFSNKYHFLPAYNHIKGGLINFQKLKSVSSKKIIEDHHRIASVNGNFTKDVVARFSYYYSRQGSPDFDKAEIYKTLMA